MHLFDAHCHIQDHRFFSILDDVLNRAVESGVIFMASCGTRESDWRQLAEIAKRHPVILPSFGLHPWYVSHKTSSWLDNLEAFLDDDPHAGIGEIGLDHAIDPASFEEQEEVFVLQLRLAQKWNRPVSIHCRKAWGKLLTLLEKLGPLEAGFMIHSYSGSTEMLASLAKLGGFFSFSGSITLSRNKRAHKSLIAAPLDRILLESDAPDIPPVIDGQRDYENPNEPVNLIYMAQKVSELLERTPEDIASITMSNSKRFFRRI